MIKLFDYIYFQFVKDYKNKVDNLNFFAFNYVAAMQALNVVSIYRYFICGLENKKVHNTIIIILIILIYFFNWKRYKNKEKIKHMFTKWEKEKNITFFWKKIIIWVYTISSILFYMGTTNC